MFLAMETYGWSLQVLSQAGSGFGWQRVVLVVDGVRSKTGVVA